MITLYAVLEGRTPTGGWDVSMTCACGVRLAQRFGATVEDARREIGVTSQEWHAVYDAHCAAEHEGRHFAIEWIDDAAYYEGERSSDVVVTPWDADAFFALAEALGATFSDEQGLSRLPTPADDL